MFLVTVGITIGIFAVALLALSVGYMVQGRCLSGTCGGESVQVGGEALSCSSCPKRQKGECNETVPLASCDGDGHHHPPGGEPCSGRGER